MVTQTLFWMVNNGYGNEPYQTTIEQFLADCAETWPDEPVPELHWRTDGDAEWYVNELDELTLAPEK